VFLPVLFLGTLFQPDYDLLLYDLTSTYFEGLAHFSLLGLDGVPIRPVFAV